ncbi:MAG: endonuclease/exonuclease/phosphatase family protein, partial [Myxococcales bacterium]|nr:endonuclease/exonuclease/phosphatase family protein [Myxococcales bacterium]
LRVMAWNIKYAAGRLPFWFDCWGDRVQMSAGEVHAHLAGLTGLIREADPDVLIVSEIELNSRRSAYVDMVRAILRDTDLNYAAYFRTWDSRYIPSEGLGRMDLGNAIFSKYPIPKAERIRQADRTDLDALTEPFYIQRAIGRATVDLGAQAVTVFAVHTEAYDEDGTKQKQIAQIFEVARATEGAWLLGGDFNELPPTALQTEGFLDERTTAVCGEDFEQPPYTPEVMAPFFAEFAAWIPLDRFGDTPEAQARYFTHTVLGPDEVNEAGVPGDWSRTLDYLFASPGTGWDADSTDVLQRAGQRVGGTDWTLQADPLRLSDHAPVFGIWRLR